MRETPPEPPLPHGPEARFISRIVSLSDSEVTAVASPDAFRARHNIGGTVDLSEWALELFAQAGALLVGPGRKGGVVAKIDSLQVNRPLVRPLGPLFLRVERLSEPDAVLAHFRGSAAFNESCEDPDVTAEFRLHIPHA